MVLSGFLSPFGKRTPFFSRIDMDMLTQLKHKKILLIDDDEWIRDSMGSFFDSEGCLFQAVESAEAGIDSLRGGDYDIIIADYRLPGMDGLAFFNRIRASHATAIKILITAYGDGNWRRKPSKRGSTNISRSPSTCGTSKMPCPV
jgi:two-component system response regulator TtrR